MAQQPAGSGGPSETPDWQMNPEIEIFDWTVIEKTESRGFAVLDGVQPKDSSAALVKFSCHMRDAFVSSFAAAFNIALIVRCSQRIEQTTWIFRTRLLSQRTRAQCGVFA